MKGIKFVDTIRPVREWERDLAEEIAKRKTGTLLLHPINFSVYICNATINRNNGEDNLINVFWDQTSWNWEYLSLTVGLLIHWQLVWVWVIFLKYLSISECMHM